MAARDLLHELRLGAHHVGERLPRFGMRPEGDEIDRVAVGKRDADLAVRLEPADARAMPRARIDDHVGPLPVEHLDARGRRDAQKHIIDRPLQRPPVDDRLVIVDENRRRAGRLMRGVVLGSLAQRVDRQRRPLRGVSPVIEQLLDQLALDGRAGYQISQRLRLAHRLMRERILRSADAFGVGDRGALQKAGLLQTDIGRFRCYPDAIEGTERGLHSPCRLYCRGA